MLPKKKIEGLVEYWVKSSQEDLKTMQALYESRRYDSCLFWGHLLLEKILKAFYVITNNKQAPKSHNLRRLAELGNVELTKDEQNLLSRTNDFNMEARYPSVKQKFYKLCTKSHTDQFYDPIITLYKKLCRKFS